MRVSRCERCRSWSSPSATSTSVVSRTGAAPCESSWLVPALVELKGAPGTAITVTPRFNASSTVIMEPPVSRDSTTTNTSLSAARIRLRKGNRNASGAQPGGDSDNTTPCSATEPHNVACSRGYTTSRPDATTAIGGAASPGAAIPGGAASSASSAPRCAAASIPRANPDTTATPLAANSHDSLRAKWRPAALAARVPTTPTRRCRSAAMLPRTNSTAGALGSPRRASGYSTSLNNSTDMPDVVSDSAICSNNRSVADCRHTRPRSCCAKSAAMRGVGGSSPRMIRHASYAPSSFTNTRSRCGPTCGSDASAAATTCSVTVGDTSPRTRLTMGRRSTAPNSFAIEVPLQRAPRQ